MTSQKHMTQYTESFFFLSIDRKTIIENLKDYKVHENAIDVIADTYTEDKTTLEYGN